MSNVEGLSKAGQTAEWGADLTLLAGRVGHVFNRPEPRVVLADMLAGLLADFPRKNAWTLAEHAGHAGPWRMQWLLHGAAWDADALRDEVRGYVVERLGDQDATLVLDDAQVPKKGAKSIGVAQQYCERSGRTENCQTRVMCTYAVPRGHAFIDRALYLPMGWAADRSRCRPAGVPDGVRFLTKPQLAIGMLARALHAAVPFRFVTAGPGYGCDPELRAFCHRHPVAYVFAIPADLLLTTTSRASARPRRASDLLGRVRPGAWERCDHEREWASVAVTGQPHAPGFRHTVLFGRQASDPSEVGYFLAHTPQPVPVADLITAAGRYGVVEDANRRGNPLLGFDTYQVRKWAPWHRYMSICMLARAYLAVSAGPAASWGNRPQDLLL
jgi:SRSO17 transposase